MTSLQPMSSQPTPPSSAPAPPLSAPVAASQPAPAKPQRVLSCVLCQQRKVRCDRRFPCANCTRAGARCVPATLAPRQRRRRFPERELLDRLRHYEDLMRQYHVPFEPLHKVGDGSEHRLPPAAGAGGDHSDEETPEASASENLSPSETVKSEWTSNADNFLHVISQGLHEPDEEGSLTDDARLRAWFKNSWDQLRANSDHLLLGSRRTAVDLSTLHPNPVHIFRLWQLYIDNVNPLLKVTHVPSLQSRIVEAAADVAALDPALEALLFAVYSVAVRSLTAEDCMATFSAAKEDLLAAYQFGCEQALGNCEFLRTSDRDCLTALLLYLISFGHKTDPRSMSSMFGVAIRIAHRMGIHKEAVNLRYPALEAEMRRRLWWTLVLFDARLGELCTADNHPTTLSPIWDCRVPRNLNDADLLPEMKEAPAPRDKCTEALFAVVRGEIGEYLRYAPFYMDFASAGPFSSARLLHRPDSSSNNINSHNNNDTNASNNHSSNSSNTHDDGKGNDLDALEARLHQKYLRFCDPQIPLHFITLQATRGQLAKFRLIQHYWRHSRAAAPPPTPAEHDAALTYALDCLDSDARLMTDPRSRCFAWHAEFHFPFPAYVHIVQDLRRRPLGPRADLAWESMSDHFEARIKPRIGAVELPFVEVLGRIVMRGWDARVAAFRGRGGDHDEVVIPSPPRIVTHMQSILAAGSASASVKLSSSGRGGDAVAGETGRKPEAAPSLGDGQSVGGVLSDLGLGLGVGMDGLDGAGYASSFPMMGFEANLLFDDTSMGDPAAAAGAAAAAASAGGGFAQFGEATGASATDLYDDFVAPSALLRPTEADVNQLNWATLGWSLGDGRSG